MIQTKGRLAERIQKQDPYTCCLQETHFRHKDTYRLIVRGQKNIFHANRKQKKAGVAILISEKIDCKIKKIRRDKEEHYIMIKGSIQEDIIIINVYTPNIGLTQYIRQTEGWYGEGGGRRVQGGEHMYTCGGFILIFGKTNTIM